MLYASDLITQYLPWYYLASQYLKLFQLPHWVPNIYNSGYPLLAEGETGILSPINSFILFLFPFSLAVELLYIVYFLIGLLGMYLFLRLNKLSKISSFLGGIIFILSGFMISRYFQTSIIFSAALTPLGFAIIKRVQVKKDFLFLLPIVIYLQITAGHLQIALISISGYLTYQVILLIFKEGRVGLLFKTCLVIILSFVLSAVQLLPSLKLFQLSDRQNWDPMVRFAYSLPLSHLITYINPSAFGISKPGDDLGFTQFGGGFWELNLTIWTLPFLLSLIPLILLFKKNKNAILTLYILWIIFLLLSFGGFFKPYHIVSYIPHFPLRAPSRFLLIATFCAASLAAYGFEIVIKNKSQYFKIILLFIVLVSIIIQEKNQLKNYFITFPADKVIQNLQNLSGSKLTTPLILSKTNYENNYFYIFKKEFEKGLIISFISAFILLLWGVNKKCKL